MSQFSYKWIHLESNRIEWIESIWIETSGEKWISWVLIVMATITTPEWIIHDWMRTSLGSFKWIHRLSLKSTEIRHLIEERTFDAKQVSRKTCQSARQEMQIVDSASSIIVSRSGVTCIWWVSWPERPWFPKGQIEGQCIHVAPHRTESKPWDGDPFSVPPRTWCRYAQFQLDY